MVTNMFEISFKTLGIVGRLNSMSEHNKKIANIFKYMYHACVKLHSYRITLDFSYDMVDMTVHVTFHIHF